MIELRHWTTKAVATIALGCSTAPSQAIAQNRGICPDGAAPPARVVALDGSATLKSASGNHIVLALGNIVCPGDTISVSEAGRLELRFADKNTTLGIAQNSTIRIPDNRDADGGPSAELVSGILKFLSSVRGFFSVRTKETNAAIDGTEAVLIAGPALGATLVLVQEGDVTLSPDGTDAILSLAAGDVGIAEVGRAPRLATRSDVPEPFSALVASPDDATDWAIYYPPVLLGAGSPSPAIARATALLRAWDPEAAERVLAGQEDGPALALRAVVAVLRNRPEEGLGFAASALAVDTNLAAAHVAQSYALQGLGQVSEARQAAARAVQVGPDDAFAWARLAELALNVGDQRDARHAAQRSLALQPNTLALSVAGFIALDEHRRNDARIAFDKAIALDSNAPLPRLGRGLVMIRDGDIAAGRQELETAAALDPRRAGLRNWLGRAYAAERRPEKALSQFDLAKAQDPEDPTPWLFSAETLFAQNRPVEALGEIKAARDRAGGRAVLRSARGLGEDRATQGAALGRALDVLGFGDQAINAGTHAAEQDPASPVAHRLLADLFSEREGVEIARTSSLLRAQVFSPPSKAPIDPSLAESDLALLDGPAITRPSFADFTRFFETDGLAAQLTGGVGTQSTLTDTVSFNALAEGYSIGIAQFHSETDGYRTNNDVSHDIVDFELKGEVLPWLTLFGEYRYRNSSYGDRTLEFDLIPSPPGADTGDERNLARFGFNAEIDGNQNFVGTFSYIRRNSSTRASGPAPLVNSVTNQDDRALEMQLQHVGTFGQLTTQIGGSLARTETDLDINSRFLFSIPLPFPGLPPLLVPISIRQMPSGETDHVNIYGYGTWRKDGLGPLAGAEITGGLSLDFYDNNGFGGQDTTEVNPKFGARLFQTDDIALRGAYTETLTPVDLLNQRLEPVSVAVFVQFFDQVAGATVNQAAGGLDARILPDLWPNLWVGAEGARRWIDSPAGGASFDTNETAIRAYANTTFGDRIAAGVEASYEMSKSNFAPDLDEFESTEVRGRVSYFHPSGFFAAASGGWVWHQFADNLATVLPRAGRDNFPVFDLAAGFRLPNQRGLISIEMQNVPDTSFGYEDRPLVAVSTPIATPRYAREFTVLGRLTLNF